ncbi:hypothetical protein BH23BAC2_BH23BAC2_12020 [soil metagenome]
MPKKNWSVKERSPEWCFKTEIGEDEWLGKVEEIEI